MTSFLMEGLMNPISPLKQSTTNLTTSSLVIVYDSEYQYTSSHIPSHLEYTEDIHPMHQYYPWQETHHQSQLQTA
jgi:hypothetical protein